MSEQSLFKLTAEDRRAAIDKLVAGAAPGSEFYLLLILSTVIVTLGVLLDSAAVVIGGMLVAPIIAPILSLSMSIVMADIKLLIQSGKVLIISMSLVLIIALIISLAFVQLEANAEILSRVQSSVAYLIVAIAAGVAAAFAFARPKLSEAIPGIAVTVALLPPLVVSAIGIPLGDFSITVRSLGLFGLNFIGIVFAAMIIFSFMGFYGQREQAVKKLEKELENQAEEKARNNQD